MDLKLHSNLRKSIYFMHPFLDSAELCTPIGLDRGELNIGFNDVSTSRSFAQHVLMFNQLFFLRFHKYDDVRKVRNLES